MYVALVAEEPHFPAVPAIPTAPNMLLVSDCLLQRGTNFALDGLDCWVARTKRIDLAQPLLAEPQLMFVEPVFPGRLRERIHGGRELDACLGNRQGREHRMSGHVLQMLDA